MRLAGEYAALYRMQADQYDGLKVEAASLGGPTGSTTLPLRPLSRWEVAG
jgi:hypothetical protein